MNPNFRNWLMWGRPAIIALAWSASIAATMLAKEESATKVKSAGFSPSRRMRPSVASWGERPTPSVAIGWPFRSSQEATSGSTKKM